MTVAAEPTLSPLAQAISGEHIVRKSWDVSAAYRYCESLAKSHYENFPVGSILIPQALRKHFYSIYAFARTADDFADEAYGEGYTDQHRLELLDEWLRMLRECFEGRATHPIFIALSETASKFDLPIGLFEDLLSAFSQDVTVRRYRTLAELLDYCRRSANPVGRLILLLFGHRDPQMHAWSDDICSALQLANHWQDIRIDLDKDRIYLPSENLERFGLTEEDLKRSEVSESFTQLMRFEVQRARAMFDRGKRLCTEVRGRLGLELRVVWLGGVTILERIEQNGYDVFNRRPVISSADKLRILSLAVRTGAFRRY